MVRVEPSLLVNEMKRRMREEKLSFDTEWGYKRRPYLVKAHSCNAQEVIITGGNRSGKSTFLTVELIWWAADRHPYKKLPSPPHYMVHGAPNYVNAIEGRIIPSMYKELVPRRWLRGGSWETAYDIRARVLYFDKNGGYHNPTGQIKFLSYQMPIEDWEGDKRHGTGFDEEPPEDVYDVSLRRKARGGFDAKIWVAATLGHGEQSGGGVSWLKYEKLDRIDTDPNIKHFTFNSRDNLSSEQIADMERGMTENEKRIFIGGEVIPLTGNVFHEFKPDSSQLVDPFDIPKGWKVLEAIDSHPHTPYHWLKVALHPSKNWVYVIDEIAPQSSILIDEFASILKVKTMGEEPYVRVIDTEGNTPNPETGKTGRQLLWELGIQCVNARKSKSYDIFLDINKALQNAANNMGDKRLYIFKSCPAFIREIKSYVWDKYRYRRIKAEKQIPLKINDHLMDCLRYIWNVMPFRYSGLTQRHKRPSYNSIHPSRNLLTGRLKRRLV